MHFDPTIRYVTLSTIQDAIDPKAASWRIGATVFSLAGLLALVVAAVGMYSVMSYLVADRTHEIGVRLALGARRADLARMLVGGSTVTAAIGVAVGSLGALLASRFVEPLLFDVSARDPLIYGAVAAVLIVVAIAAAIVPTIRASRIDPLEALRVE
jgi:ABC-type antimicrobial peptide transport system permease subunit